LNYLWNKPDDQEKYIYEKISWIEYVPELDWYIVSSMYKSELQKSSIELRDFLIHTALFVFVVFIIMAYFIFRRIDKNIEDKTNEIKTLQERMETAINANKDFYESVYRVRHKGGHWIWIHSRGNTTFDKDRKAARFVGTFTDVTEKKELENELKIYKKIVDSTNSHMSYIDTNYVYKAVNPMYSIVHNKSKEEIVGHTVSELLGEDVFKNLLKENLDLCFSGKEVHYSAWFEMAVDKIYMDVSYIPHKNSKGKVIGVVVSANNITKLQTTEEALKKLANVDPLTKLYNRRYLFDMARKIISLAKRERTKVSMLMIDID
jgi:PAS domain S-box-containing protein